MLAMVCLGPFSRALLPSVVTLLAWACAPSSAPPETAAGMTLSDPSRVDFGSVHEGRILRHAWRLEIEEPLVVRETKSDCGCTLVGLTRAEGASERPYELGDELIPGEILVVRASYDTRGRLGPSERTLSLLLADGRLLPLKLAASVQRWLVAEPEPAFQRTLEGQALETRFEVRSLDGKPFRLTPTGRAVPPALTLAPRALAPDAEGRAARWEVVARLAADAPRGTHSYPLELESDVALEADGRVHTIAPAWNLQVLGPVALSTPSLEFGLVRADETVARSVRLECFDSSFVLAEPRVQLEALRPGESCPLLDTAHLTVRAQGAAYDIELTLAGLSPAIDGNFMARLVIETGHPRLARLEALVRGVRAPEGRAR